MRRIRRLKGLCFYCGWPTAYLTCTRCTPLEVNDPNRDQARETTPPSWPGMTGEEAMARLKAACSANPYRQSAFGAAMERRAQRKGVAGMRAGKDKP